MSKQTQTQRTLKRVISHQVLREMFRQGLNKKQFAELLNTSRASVDRLLDPENDSITLTTLENVAKALDLKLEIYLNNIQEVSNE